MMSCINGGSGFCQADKEFVWLLWKQLQKQSPDLTSTVDMVVTRYYITV